MVKEMKKISLLTLAVFLWCGLPGSLAAQAAKVPAALAAAVGVVDYDRLMTGHPDMLQADAALRAETEQANKEFAAQTDKLSDKEKQDLAARLEQRVELKRQSLMTAIANKVDAAVKETAEAKGVTIVVQKEFVAYGGLDITEEVLKKITGK